MYRGHDVSYVHVYNNGPLNEFKREHYAKLAFSTQENSGKPLKRSSDNANAPSCHEEVMRLRVQRSAQPNSQLFQVLFRQRRVMSIIPDEAPNARNFQHF